MLVQNNCLWCLLSPQASLKEWNKGSLYPQFPISHEWEYQGAVHSNQNIEVLSLTLGYAPQISLHWFREPSFLYKSFSLKATCIASSLFGLERSFLCQDSNKPEPMGIQTVCTTKKAWDLKNTLMNSKILPNTSAVIVFIYIVSSLLCIICKFVMHYN